MISKFENNAVFSETEAWNLFRLAAWAEAVGWTLLIIGIGLKRYVLVGNNLPVLLAGRTHGLFFMLYALAGLGLYPNLGWSRQRALVATLASVPPYGSLLFEQWASHQRQTERIKIQHRVLALHLLAKLSPAK